MASAPDRIRAVYDTNVLISALAWQGETRALWDAVEHGRVALIASPFILEEFVRVLRTKLHVPPDDVDLLADEILERAEIITPSSRITAVKAKESDNRILECAVDAAADVLVTGDIKHLRPLRTFRGIDILTPAEFRKLRLG